MRFGVLWGCFLAWDDDDDVEFRSLEVLKLFPAQAARIILNDVLTIRITPIDGSDL